MEVILKGNGSIDLMGDKYEQLNGIANCEMADWRADTKVDLRMPWNSIEATQSGVESLDAGRLEQEKEVTKQQPMEYCNRPLHNILFKSFLKRKAEYDS
ncbi:MAG: hypothetical protein EZS28_003793 [Streblomastix strix]|uniref:Uncharacterized protein n=1 Tax=Streblomastix strix TaxID=222440 RepID=A0A5J4X1R5_9EUKA|nr:MAG: hypothetical protein EZS28_003793 [Streblomastix strix]